VAIFEDEKKMVAITCNNYFVITWIINSFCRRHSARPLYLYIILIFKVMKKTDRFEILFTISTGLILLVFILKGNRHLLFGLICLNILALLIKPFSNLIATVWIKMTDILGYVSSTILLSLIYYFFLTPIAILYRIFKGNNMKTQRNSNNSMFVERTHVFSAKDFELPG
jgi:hypothetical protein